VFWEEEKEALVEFVNELHIKLKNILSQFHTMMELLIEHRQGKQWLCDKV